ncbi:MAG: methyl-accepting chemotaxis protein [Desulfobacula sp.]|nr:methyl-accepting chemotaxis protein [Desulfobacula sp.]
MKINIFNPLFQVMGFKKNIEIKHKGAWMSVGVKMMLGVGLISSICICALIYINYQAFAQLAIETNAFMEINTSMNQDLRTSIFDLQEKYLDIPRWLEVDAGTRIKRWIENNYLIENREQLKGRESYGKSLNRSQRRDISKGKFIVQQKDKAIIILKGLLDENNNFTDTIDRISLKTDNPLEDIGKIKLFLRKTKLKEAGTNALRVKILGLKNMLADEALAAETARNAILYKVEELEKIKADLTRYRDKKKQTIGLIALMAILVNLMLLNLMAWLVVEKPLKRLTFSIDQINSGNTITIPCQDRKDRIGVLARTLEKFQRVSLHLRREDLRKKKERQMINQLIQKMSGVIEAIQLKANTMKDSAAGLNALCVNTQGQTDTAEHSVLKTAEQTDLMSYSTGQLKGAVESISRQISKQTRLVDDISEVTQVSRKDMGQLNQASIKINEIVSIVKNISGETKLLALNARIEAARTGEAGNGFAVVAREVRELSIQTEAANDDIAQKISSIQKVSKVIIERTQHIESRIERLMDVSRQISAAVEKQRAVTSGIAENAHVTATEIKNVAGRVSNVRKATNTTSRFAGDVQTYSEQIESQLTGLLLETREKLSGIGLSKKEDKDIQAPPWNLEPVNIFYKTKKRAAG